MSSSVVAAAVLLGGSFANAVDPEPPIYAVICAKYDHSGQWAHSGGSFNPTNNLEGNTCGDLVEEMGITNMTDITEAACMMPMTAAGAEGMTMRDGLMYLQFYCCEDGRVEDGLMLEPAGRCGEHFPDGTMCKTDGVFAPMKGAGSFQCNGDEEIDKANCEFQGQSGWDENEEECDVGRMDFGDGLEGAYTLSKQNEACDTMGGSWEEHSCMNIQTWLTQMMESGMDMCTDQTMSFVIPMYAKVCCTDERPITEDCVDSGTQPGSGPVTPPEAHGNLCIDMAQFKDEGTIPGSEECKGLEVISERSQCLPGGEEGAWDADAEPGKKCDVGRLRAADGDDSSLQSRACLELSGSWEPAKCVEMLAILPMFWCAVMGFEEMWGAIGQACCGESDTTAIQCTVPVPSPGGPQGQCGQVSQAAIESARRHGYEPRLC